MGDLNTEIGGPGRPLPTTEHPLLASIREGDPRRRDAELERLVGLYWKPVYKFVRLKFRKGNEEAKDLTQAFFASAIERDRSTFWNTSARQ